MEPLCPLFFRCHVKRKDPLLAHCRVQHVSLTSSASKSSSPIFSNGTSPPLYGSIPQHIFAHRSDSCPSVVSIFSSLIAYRHVRNSVKQRSSRQTRKLTLCVLKNHEKRYPFRPRCTAGPPVCLSRTTTSRRDNDWAEANAVVN